MGVASLTEETLSVEQLVSRADKALYQAKRQGKNCVVVAEEEMALITGLP